MFWLTRRRDTATRLLSIFQAVGRPDPSVEIENVTSIAQDEA